MSTDLFLSVAIMMGPVRAKTQQTNYRKHPPHTHKTAEGYHRRIYQIETPFQTKQRKQNKKYFSKNRPHTLTFYQKVLHS